MATSLTFAVPFVVNNPGSWGPPPPESSLEDIDQQANPNGAPLALGNIAKFAALPYAPFGRSDRLGRAADFTGNNRGASGGAGGGFGPGGTMGGRRMRGGDNERFFRRQQGQLADEDREGAVAGGEGGDETFQLVDTAKTTTNTKRFVNPTKKRLQHNNRLRLINARRQQSAGGAAGPVGLDKMTRGGPGGGAGGRMGRGGGRGGGRGPGGGGRGGGRHGPYAGRVDRSPSVPVQSDWKQVEELDLGKLTKNLTASTTVPSPQDVLWCGFLDHYNETYDKITARQPVPLKRMEHKEFYPVTTTDDPVLEKLAIDGAGQVFITDTILSHLMTCTRSVFPWDVVIQKLPNGTLFFDKRDNSPFDYLTVQETAYSPPADEDGINTPERLGLEATTINQNFSQQILKKAGRQEMDLPNPFFDEDDADGMEPASVAFRYRKFALDDKISLICRTELHGLVKKTQYMTSFALNEYIPSNASNNPQLVSWRDKIDSQRGAVLATEMKNNAFKLAKWTAQSLLAGADQMKIGFVSRVSPKNSYDHVILATQFYRPKDFATQITLVEGQMWAMFRMFVHLLMKQAEGKYVLMRDPNKAVLRLYKVPANTFDEE